MIVNFEYLELSYFVLCCSLIVIRMKTRFTKSGHNKYSKRANHKNNP